MRRTALLGALAASDDEVAQALALLAAGGVEDPDRLPLGAGDRRLLDLHREVTGRKLEIVVACPACGELSSVELVGADFPPPRARVAALGAGGGLREPTYGDLAGLPDGRAAAVAELLRRCVVGEPAREPEPGDLDLVDDSLSGPLVLACADCGQPIEMQVDLERAVLESVERSLEALELEVHLLARSYHWPLEQIEQLPDARRSRLAEYVTEGR